ncbi:MAG: hypothetical protein JWQ04_325 [Pedosphaera sp.]|nr:hypothetical protein [Pedosphaera sp.]
MTTFSLKLPKSLLREIAQEAEARSVAKSAVVRDCIERALHRNKKAKSRVTCLDLMGDQIGSFSGPRDLSTNRRHLLKAVTAHANRGSKSSR